MNGIRLRAGMGAGDAICRERTARSVGFVTELHRAAEVLSMDDRSSVRLKCRYLRRAGDLSDALKRAMPVVFINFSIKTRVLPVWTVLYGGSTALGTGTDLGHIAPPAVRICLRTRRPAAPWRWQAVVAGDPVAERRAMVSLQNGALYILSVPERKRKTRGAMA